jgi:hypothetical protein
MWPPPNRPPGCNCAGCCICVEFRGQLTRGSARQSLRLFAYTTRADIHARVLKDLPNRERENGHSPKYPN